MREIIRMMAGSRLYGTMVPESDEDHKSVYIPAARPILLQREKGGVCAKIDGVDWESFSLHKYISLLLAGQTVALDMLFTPEEFYIMPPQPEWLAVQANKERFLCKGVSAFVGYCRGQVRRYAVKVERYAATAATVARLEYLCTTQSARQAMGYHMDSWDTLVAVHEDIKITTVKQASGVDMPHLSVAGTLIPLTVSLTNGLQMMRLKLDKYGERVKQVNDMTGADWKSMMHAVRVAGEAVEFLETKKLTFPRPEASLLLAIRMGKIPYAKVCEMIEVGLETVEKALEESSLPEEPDREFAEGLVEDFYRNAVLRARSSAG